MRVDYSINKYIKRWFYILIAMMLFGLICGEAFYPSEMDQGASPDRLAYEGILIWEKSDGSEEQIVAPGNYEVAAGEVMVITTILPEDYNKNTIEIRGSQQTVRFYIDGELRAEYDTKDSRPFGSESASRYVFCNTSQADAGKELRIELRSNYERYSGMVNEILCGDKVDIWIYIFSKYGLESINALFILFVGIVTVIFSVALSIAYRFRINLIYLGWSIILGALWILVESRLRQLVVPNVSVLTSVGFEVAMLCPVPVLFYVDSVQKGRYKKFFCIIEGIAILNLLVSVILQVTETADYMDTLSVSVAVLIITFLSVLVTFFLDYRKGKIKEYLLSVIGLVVAMIGAAVEVASIYWVMNTAGLFLGIGLLILLFFTIIKTINDIRSVENERQKEQLEKRKKQTEAMSLQVIRTLSNTIEAKDEYTKGHSYRVAEYSALIARELGWSDKEAENLRNAAYLHDVGKIGVPDTILNKPAKLLDAEYEIIKRHTVIGADILKNITLIDHVEEVARYHHERYDGHGYPEGLAGEEIPIHARIVMVADCYDAMNSKRIYRNPLSKERIRAEILENRGGQFDPVIADTFIKLLDEGRVQIDEKNQSLLVSGVLSELEMDETMEAGKFISEVVDTVKSQKESESMDYLTGLPMRNLGEMQIAQNMQMHGGCLVFLDMDNLKKINDIYGHKAGDKALKLLGNTISDYAGDSIACRLGGDEFLLFLKDITKDAVSELIDQIFKNFNDKKDKDVTIRSASLSGGLCMCLKGDSFADCYAKADKALYYVKQNGKNHYSFYHQLEQECADWKPIGKDLAQLVKAIRESGNYTGALDLDQRGFAKIYEYISNLSERYKHSCHLVMITMDTISDNTMFIEKIEHALDCMEMAIRSNIRNVDVCTRYSSMQYLVILMEVGEDNISLVADRIFAQYYKSYNGYDFRPRYEYMPMLEA